MTLHTIDDVWVYLSSLIIDNQPFAVHPEIPYKRALYLLERLGNPQNNLKVIHIAGTSGKGSTAYYLSLLLGEHGKKVGLHISPHLVDVRERFQINNRLISNEILISCLNRVKAISDEMMKTSYGHASYFEVLVAMSFLLFYEQGVDYAVMETGMGGWYDATNSVKRTDKLCIITPIGFDHMNALGNTLAKIALQKAKIIQRGNSVITYRSHASARRVIEKTASEEHADLMYFAPGKNSRNVALLDGRVEFDFIAGDIQLNRLTLNTPALYQVENAGMALMALTELAHRDGFGLKEDAVRAAFAQPSFPGRMDLVKIRDRFVLFDGAHNPQKMKAFLRSLTISFPGKKFHFLLAFKKGKDFETMMKEVCNAAEDIHITNFVINVQDSNHLSEDPFEVAAYSGLINPDVPVRVVPAPQEAYKAALDHIKKGEMLVVTGSLYLISCLYKSV